ncbi:DUF3885 domain-containing protein [Bacillus altitudinis]
MAADAERLRPVYGGLQHWLLDYDRAQMDQLFAGNKKNRTFHKCGSRLLTKG